MKKFLITLLMSAFALALSIGLAACGGLHEHTYTSGSDWSWDAKGHYHRATCEHTDLRADYEPHRFMPTEGGNVCMICRYTEPLTTENCKHGYDNVVVSPTCEEQGYTLYTCRYCGDTEKKAYTNPTGHSYTYTVTQTPTADKEGLITGVCKYDRTHTDTAVLNALNKTDYTYTVKTAAQCEVEGTANYRYADKTYGTFNFEVTLEALEHDYQEKVCSLCQDHFDFTYTISGSACTITGFKGDPNETQLVIPQTIKGAAVRTIDKDAFKDMTNLVSVTAGDGLLRINEGAFAGCTNLKSLDLPVSRYTSVSADAFSGCTSLESVAVPIDLLGCLPVQNLKSVTIKDGTSIASNAFKNCTALEEIVLPDTLTRIYSSAFENCYNLTSITVPGTVREISQDAFKNCYKLVEVVNLSNLSITAGSEGNGGIAGYAKAVLGKEDESILKTQNGFVYFVHNGTTYLLSYNESVSELVLPENLGGENYKIYSYAFYNRTDIRKLTISEGVTEIQPNAFLNAKKLYEVFNYSDLVITGYTGDYTGYYAYNIQNMKNPDSSDESVITESSDFIFVKLNGNYYLVDYTGGDVEITLPEKHENSTYIIGKRAFATRTDLTGITIPAAVEEFAEYAFEGCTARISFGGTPAIQTIGEYAFYGYAGDSITLPDSVTEIADFAFAKCSLGEIVLPANLEAIGANAFMECKYLKNIVLPSSVATLGSSAFRYSGLENIELSESLINIPDYAFGDCSALVTVTLSTGVKEVAYNAFYNCTALEDVYYTGDISDWLEIEFGRETNSGSDRYFRYYYSYANPMIYASHFYANGDRENEVTSIVIPEGITLIGSYQFAGFVNLQSVTFPADPAESIFLNVGAFYGCTSLTSVALPARSDLSPYVFAGCTALESLTIPEANTSYGTGGYVTTTYLPFGSLFGTDKIEGTVATTQHYYTEIPDGEPIINEMTFYIPAGLKTVTVHNLYVHPERTVQPYTFENCRNIENLVYNTRITTVGDHAFENSGINPESYENMDFDGLTTIGKYAFAKSKIESANFTQLTYLGEYAFSECSQLKYAFIPDTIEEIKDYTFYDSGLERIDTYQYRNGVKVKTQAEVGEAFFSSKISYFGEYAFRNKSNYNSSKFSHVTFFNFETDEAHRNFRTAGSTSFSDLDKLTAPAYVAYYIRAYEVIITQGLLETVDDQEVYVLPDYMYYNVNSEAKSNFGAGILTIAEEAGISRIGRSLCYTSLRTLNIPSTVTYINTNCLRYCDYLSEINLNMTLEQWETLSFYAPEGDTNNHSYNVKYIGDDGEIATVRLRKTSNWKYPCYVNIYNLY